MITLRNISKSYGAQTLFEDASLQINLGDRMALVGRNGAGKSTLFRMILGSETVDSGEINIRPDVRLGYLPQETPSQSHRPVLEETLGASLSGARDEARAKKILMGLGFKISDFDRPVAELSGGWQMRVMIARLLFEAPDLLMLDEPTNHLDLEALLWFQNYLRSYKGSLFVISHDRELINAVTTRIIEVGRGTLKIYPGSYEDFAERKKQEKELLISAYKRQRKEIEDLETFISRFRAKATLASSVQSKIKYLERMERIELPPEDKTVGFSFPQPARCGQIALALKNVRQSYDGSNFVYDGLNMELERGQKIALVGPNGAGKSTMLKILAGVLPIQGGERKLGFNVELGYFSQHRAQMFKEGRTVFQEAADTRRAHSETTIRSVLGSFLLRGEAADKRVEVLSGGEKSRLGLAKLLLDPPNVLLMDEPTTHLDMDSVEVLIEATKSFEGTMCFISHDVYFIRQVANNVLHVNQGKVTWYPGGYDYFLHRKAQEDSEEAALFRSEEEIEQEVHHKHRPAGSSMGTGSASPTEQRRDRNPSAPENSDGSDKPAPDWGNSGKKTKEQKRLEAEERNAKYRAKLERQKMNKWREELELEEKEILKELGKPETHRDGKHVKELMIRLGEVRRKLKTSGT